MKLQRRNLGFERLKIASLEANAYKCNFLKNKVALLEFKVFVNLSDQILQGTEN